MLLPMLGVMLALVSLIVGASWAVKGGRVMAETSRKIVHVGMGLICVSFPWLFSSVVPVCVLAGLAVAGLLILKLSRLSQSLGSSLFSVGRVSIGELLFPLSVAWLFCLSFGGPVYGYVIPLMVLTLADTAGAIAGVRYGKHGYSSAAGQKSWEGSLAFFLMAFGCCSLGLLLSGQSVAFCLWLSLAVAVFSTSIEGASGRGSDNLYLPIGVFLLIDYYISLPLDDLIVRSVLLVLLFLLLLVTKKWHSLDGGGLLGAVVLCFAAYSIGGAVCFLAALLVFVRHLFVQRLIPEGAVYSHSSGAVLAVGAPGLIWLSAYRMGWLGKDVAQGMFVCCMAIVVGLLHIGTQRFLGRSRPSVIKALLLCLVVSLMALLMGNGMVFVLGALLILLPLCYIFHYWRSRKASLTIDWVKLSVLNLAASISFYYAYYGKFIE